MSPSRRKYVVWIGIFVFVLIALVVSIAVLRHSWSKAGFIMPADQRDYRERIGSINRSTDTAVESGIRRLREHPHYPALYLRLSLTCLEQDKKRPFLVEDLTLSIAPSAAILRLGRERNPCCRSYVLLGAHRERQLPGACRKTETIASSTRSRHHMLISEETTQQMSEQVTDTFDIIHFTTHDYFDHRTPRYSYLELYDDILRIEEIERLEPDAYLDTLSTCDTALSGGVIFNVPISDEWIGLNQSFLAAGTPTVMASLWPIDVSVSSTFVSGFYDNLGNDGKSYALAAMQHQFI